MIPPPGWYNPLHQLPDVRLGSHGSVAELVVVLSEPVADGGPVIRQATYDSPLGGFFCAATGTRLEDVELWAHRPGTGPRVESDHVSMLTEMLESYGDEPGTFSAERAALETAISVLSTVDRFGASVPMHDIPVEAARAIADRFGYDQVIVVARRVDEEPAPSGEHVTTYGRGLVHAAVAARVGHFLRHRLMGWPETVGAGYETLSSRAETCPAGDIQCRTCAQMPAKPEILFQSIVACVESFLAREADGDAPAAAEWRRQVHLYAQALANATAADEPAKQVFAGDVMVTRPATKTAPAIQPGQRIALEMSEQAVRDRVLAALPMDAVADPKVGPDAVYPVPEDREDSQSLEPGPWMPGDMKPVREGGYLRAFDEGDAFSTWRGGTWHTGDFFDRESDIQDAPWRGGVLVDGATHEDWHREHGAEYAEDDANG